MNEHNTPHLHNSLRPLALIYKAVVQLRNRLFDWKILPSETYDIPVISVGNITVGGTGKTPHTEYLIHLLAPHYHIALLSRGYKRKSRGFVIAEATSTSAQVGDEPLQIKRKFPHITVAVDADRRRGIRQIRKHFPETNLILLDDAFQHRYVTPSTSILLTDINRLIYEDKMLPAGRLREPLSGKSRANIVIVTKCPDDIKPIDFRIIAKHLQLYPYQRLYFTTFRYGDLTPVFPRTCTIPQDTPVDVSLYKNVVAVSGIASPHTFIHHIHTLCPAAQSLTFADHHDFTARDITRIKKLSTQAPPDDTLVIVTEKDAARLMHNRHIDTPLKQRMLYLPLRVAFLQDGGPAFDAQILDEAKKNSPSYIPNTGAQNKAAATRSK